MSCEYCQEPFSASDPRQIYCNAACRLATYRIRRRENEALERALAKPGEWTPSPLPKPPPWRFHEVPVAIVAHPRRDSRPDGLALLTNAEAVVVDDQDYGCEINHLRAWEWLGGGDCPWSVVIEDDAVPVQRFRYQLHAALRVAPTPIVSLYLGRTRPPHWQASIAQAVGATKLADACFLTASALLHAVGYAVRTNLIPSLLEEVPEIARTHPIDEAITEWARRHQYRISYTWPSLVDHKDGPSLVSHKDGHPRRSGRVAWCADWRQDWSSTSAGIADPGNRVREAG